MECRSCKTQVLSQSSFCNACGEKIPFKRLTIKSIAVTTFNQLLDVDNKLLKTFKTLFTKPELTIDDYIKGFRKKYVNVIGYLGLALTILGLQFFILKKFYPELLTVDTGEVKNNIFDIQKFFDVFYDYQGLFTIALLPFYALVSRLVFIDSKKYNIAEHFVINAYATAQAFIAWFFMVMITLPLGVNYNLLSQLLSILVLIYMAFVFKRLYSFSTMNIALRVIVYTILSFMVLMIIIMVIALIAGIYLGYTGQLPTKTV